MEAELTTVRTRLNAYELVIKECSRPTAEIANSLDLEDAMVQIAIANGFFDTYDHKDLLINAGLIKGEPRTVSQKIFQTLDASEKFQPNGKKGRWNLAPDVDGFLHRPF